MKNNPDFKGCSNGCGRGVLKSDNKDLCFACEDKIKAAEAHEERKSEKWKMIERFQKCFTEEQQVVLTYLLFNIEDAEIEEYDLSYNKN